jgi:hypothetical protein
MPVLHAPTLCESAYNTPAKTLNSKSLRRLQKVVFHGMRDADIN